LAIAHSTPQTARRCWLLNKGDRPQFRLKVFRHHPIDPQFAAHTLQQQNRRIEVAAADLKRTNNLGAAFDWSTRVNIVDHSELPH
jgi:hypothetical protein